MAPIVLSMDVHCNGCAKDIRKALKKFGWVESVSASYETGLVNVEVEGVPASYEMAVVLQLRLSRKMRNKPVTIVSYGGSDEDQAPSSPAPAARARTSPPNYPPPPQPTRRYTPSSPPNYPPPSPPTSRSSSSYYTPTYSPPPTSSSSDYPPGGYYSYYAPPPRQPDGGYGYPPLDDYYNYDQSRGGPYYAPTTFNDENPNACSIQ
nr:leucine-rich repeat extensin-like protein 1 [Aegilops tauschii subsp. strangulata]